MNLAEYKELLAWVASWYAILFVGVFVIVYVFDIGKDDSDPIDGRSGAKVIVDAATGCEYLAMPKGGITPRLTSQGAHRGCKPI